MTEGKNGSIKLSGKYIAVIVTILIFGFGVIMGYGALTERVKNLSEKTEKKLDAELFQAYQHSMEKRMDRIESKLDAAIGRGQK